MNTWRRCVVPIQVGTYRAPSAPALSKQKKGGNISQFFFFIASEVPIMSGNSRNTKGAAKIACVYEPAHVDPEWQDRVLTMLTKLADKDTNQLARNALTEIIKELDDNTFQPFMVPPHALHRLCTLSPCYSTPAKPGRRRKRTTRSSSSPSARPSTSMLSLRLWGGR